MFEEMTHPIIVIFFILSAVSICIGSLLPAHWLPPIKNDKFLHFSSFALLTILVNKISHSFYEFMIWLVVLFFAGLLIEIMQILVPGRNFCWKDILSNLGGIICAAIMSCAIESI